MSFFFFLVIEHVIDMVEYNMATFQITCFNRKRKHVYKFVTDGHTFYVSVHISQSFLLYSNIRDNKNGNRAKMTFGSSANIYDFSLFYSNI